MQLKKIFLGMLLLAFSFGLFLTENQEVEALIVAKEDKEAIDCGTFWGTKCSGSGDGCEALTCKGGGEMIIQ